MFLSKYFNNIVPMARKRLNDLVELLSEDDKKDFFEYYPAGVNQIPEENLDFILFQMEQKTGSLQ